MLRQTLEPAQKLQQKQQLVPQQLQSLQILLATTTELSQKVEQEMEANPTLEMVQNGAEEEVGDPLATSDDETSLQNNTAQEASEQDEALAELMRMSDNWREYTPPDYTGTSQPSPEDEERREHFFNSLVTRMSFQDTLLEQLRDTEGLDQEQSRAAREIIGNIDDNGYLRSSLKDIAEESNVHLETAEKALKVIQSFDPPGVGARDLRECMLLQLQRRGDNHDVVYKIVQNHLNDLARNHVPAIAKALNISREDVYEAREKIRQLHPYPGSLVNAESADYVAPDVYVYRDDQGELQVSVNNDAAPQLRISSYYLNLLESDGISKEAKQYIRQKISDSKLLLRALDQRRSTLEEITHILLKHQRDFFDKGERYIRPLTLQQVADEIGVHETTVSRAIANKYVQTPHGLMSFKRFFTSGVTSEGGEKVSDEQIKARIRDLVEDEDPAKPLSDNKLTKILKDEGLNVARRTVAKYREEMGILSSNLRKSHRG